MRTNRRGIVLLSGVGAAALFAAIAAMALLATGLDTDNDGVEAPGRSIVIVQAPTSAGSTPPRGATSQPPQSAAGLSPPGRVIEHVRQAFPFLTDLDFRCDTGGCAVLATIPPPPDGDDAFLKARQEMLLGGLAKVIDAEGYQSAGPVHMDEVDSNVFRIRAAAIARPAAATGG